MCPMCPSFKSSPWAPSILQMLPLLAVLSSAVFHSKSTKKQVVLCQMKRIHPNQQTTACALRHLLTNPGRHRVAHLVSTLNSDGIIGPVNCVSRIAGHVASCVQARLADLACLIPGLIFQRFQPISMNHTRLFWWMVESLMIHDPHSHTIMIICIQQLYSMVALGAKVNCP